MFYIFLSLIFIFPAWIGFGKATEKFTQPLFKGLSSSLLMGIFAITTLWWLLSFFFPLNIYTEITTVIIGYILFLLRKGYRDIITFIHRNRNIYFITILILIIGVSSCYPYIFDHFSYYVPSIKWLSKFGLVKGIANLDLILGQMSVWHIFQAGFSNFSDPFLRINTLVIIVYLIYIFEKKQWFQVCFIPFLVAFSQSPSPDLPVIVFSLILLTEIFNKSKNLSFIFGFSVLVFSIKPTAIWLPLFSFLYGILVMKKNVKFIGLGVLLGVLFVVKNFWTFGFPIFPMTIFDFNLAWKANPTLLKDSSELALLKTYDLQYTYQEIQHFSFQEKIINWLTLKGIKGKIHLFFISLLIGFGIFTLLEKQKIYRLLFFAILIKSLIILIFSAQYRFLLDVIFIVILVVLTPIFNAKKSFWTSLFLGVVSLMIFIFPSFLQEKIPSFRLGHMMKRPQIKQIYEPSHYIHNDYQKFELGNLKFNVVKNYSLSFDTPIPAISPSYLEDYLKIGIFPQKSKDGFIWKRLSKKEKIKLKSILKKINSNSP